MLSPPNRGYIVLLRTNICSLGPTRAARFARYRRRPTHRRFPPRPNPDFLYAGKSGFGIRKATASSS